MRSNVQRQKEELAKEGDVDRGGSGSIGVMVSGWCPCVPIGRRESPAQQQSASSSRSLGTDGAPFTVSAATDRADMVQMFYYENRGKCCKKLLRYNGYPNKVRVSSLLLSFLPFNTLDFSYQTFYCDFVYLTICSILILIILE